MVDRELETDADEPAEEAGEAASLSITYRTREDLQEAFAREIKSGAVFVPTLDQLPSGRKARVAFHLLFCGARLELDGEVVASLPAHIARAGGVPGVSIQLADPPTDLRRRFGQESGIQLFEIAPSPAPFTRGEVRFPARASVKVESGGIRFSGETADISYNGMLMLLPDVDLGVGTQLRARIEHPRTGELLELEGRIANQTRCDHGVMAVGVQFVYDLARIDDVTHFVDDLRSFQHARSLATVSGSLADTPLEVVMETFSGTASEGTLRLARGDEQGKIVYRAGEILVATTGLVSGAKALGRLFTWRDAQFEFQPEVDPAEEPREELAIAPAVLAAAVQRDELARLDLSALHAETTFTVDEARLAAAAPALDEIGQEVLENAKLGFPFGAMLDMIPCSDVRIYKAFTELIEAGVLRINDD